MSRHLSRTEYCHRQAAECAFAAAATTLPDVKQAYLDMEQAWLQLAPDVASNQPLPSKPEPEALQGAFAPNNG